VRKEFGDSTRIVGTHSMAYISADLGFFKSTSEILLMTNFHLK
jgi:hypothetical protein